MARRTSLNKLDITSQKTFDLWMLRLLCRADVWKDIDTCSLGDADDFGSCFWFKPFRADLHWALAVYRNEEFLETGNVAKGRFRLSRNGSFLKSSGPKIKVKGLPPARKIGFC